MRTRKPVSSLPLRVCICLALTALSAGSVLADEPPAPPEESTDVADLWRRVRQKDATTAQPPADPDSAKIQEAF